MDRSAFQRLEALFHRAVELPAAERAALLDRECGGDTELRTVLEDMLRRDREDLTTDGHFVSPVARAASELRHDAPTMPAPVTTGTAPIRQKPPEIPGYELLEELGRGGMGVVYKARQLGLNRLVALKMLLPFAAPTHEQLARFRTEAESLARLSHPNIIPIYEVGERAAGPYYSMEYVPGPSLAAYVDGKPCDPREAARLAEVLAGAIDAVHQCGIVHRDLKPANILLAPRRDAVPQAEPGGRLLLAAYDPKITDFGLAKDRTAPRTLTLSGTTLGTPCYMAPEQAGGPGAMLGPAADVYSLGAILYEMLTGRPPFEGVTAAETIARVIGDEPLSPSRLRAGLPRDLVTICMKCLEKSPRRRYASAGELAEDLRRFQAGEPIRSRPTGPLGRAYRWCRRRPLVAGLIALCVGLAVAFVVTVIVYDVKLSEALKQARGKSEEERQEIVHLNVTIGITEMEDGDTFSAVLRFTEALRQDAGRPERERSHRTRIATALRQCPRLNRLMLPGKELLCARLSESGGQVATVGRDHVVEIWDVKTGRATGPAIPHGVAVTRAALAPDGHTLATLDSAGKARLWNLEDGTARTLVVHGGTDVRLIASRAGECLLLVRGDGPELQRWKLTERESVKMTLPVTIRGDSAFSEDGTRFFTLTNSCGQVWDVATGKTVGQPLPGMGDVVQSVMSRDGRRVACIGSDNTVRIGEPETGRWLGTPLRPHFGVHTAVFSPDGERLLTAGEGNVAILWKASTGELLSTLTLREGEAISFARFNHDGRLLVTGDGRNGARVWDAATGSPLTPPLRHGGALCAAAFTDDGRQLITAGKSGAVGVWDLPEGAGLGSDGLSRRVAVKGGTGSGTRSLQTAGQLLGEGGIQPDGIRLAVRTTDEGVRVCDAMTGQPVSPVLPHNNDVRFAVFSGDGSRLVTADARRAVRVWEIATGEMLAAASGIHGTITRLACDHDGERAVITCDGGKESLWDLSPDRRPMEELVRLARVLACGWVDDDQNQRFFDTNELRSAWQALDQSQ